MTADKYRGNSNYGIEQELHFIDMLGRWSHQGAEVGSHKLTKTYLTAIAKRTKGFDGRALLTDNERLQCMQRARMHLGLM